MLNRRPRTRRGTAAVAVVVLAATALVAGPGTATAEPGSAPAVPPATPAVPVPSPSAGPAPTGPVWLPLRRDLAGGEVKLGCTLDSHGSQFGYECGGHHDRWALDLIAAAGTPVYAAGSGYATNATGAQGGSGYGNHVRIDHGGGVQSIYAHLSQVLVPGEGAWVDENSLIGLVGSTGSSSTNHLHYEVRKTAPDGAVSSVDPGPLLACALGMVVSYPAIRGHDSWRSLPWGAFTVFSEGTDCAPPRAGAKSPAAPEAAAPATPTRIVGRRAGSFWLVALDHLRRRPTATPG